MGGLLINIIAHKCAPFSSTCDAWSYCNHLVPLEKQNLTDQKDGKNLDLDDATDVL